MAGPNFVYDKGFKVDSAATNVVFGRFCKFLASDATGATVTTSGVLAAADVSAANFVVGVYQDTLDAAKISTGKATIGVRMLGVARCEAGAALVIGDKVTVDSTGRATKVAVGASPNWMVGIALTPASGAGAFCEVLLTPAAIQAAS